MATMTDAEVESIRTAQTRQEYRERIEAIKAPHGGRYPGDWWARIKESGIMNDSPPITYGTSGRPMVSGRRLTISSRCMG
jgi:hypothetical protein